MPRHRSREEFPDDPVEYDPFEEEIPPAPAAEEAPPAPSTTQSSRYDPGRTYTQQAGWETDKLRDLSRRNPKYDFLRAAQTLGIDPKQARNNMGPIVEYLRSRGYPNIRLVGDDKINFGAGQEVSGGGSAEYGDVDVLTSGGEWWWGPPEAQGGPGVIKETGGPHGLSPGVRREIGGPHGPPPGVKLHVAPPLRGIVDGPGGEAFDGPELGLPRGSLMAPWTEKFSYDPFVAPKEAAEPQPFQPTAGFTEAFQAPDYTPAEWTEQFAAPTEAEMRADPGYQFRMTEGQKALERSAAASGTLLTGGTLKDLSQYSQGLAAQEYADVYGRKRGEHGTRYGEFADTEARKRGAYETRLGRLMGEYGSRRDVNQETYRRGREQYEAGRALAGDKYRVAKDVWETGRGAKMQEYQLARDIFEQTQEKQFGRLYKLAELGRY